MQAEVVIPKEHCSILVLPLLRPIFSPLICRAWKCALLYLCPSWKANLPSSYLTIMEDSSTFCCISEKYLINKMREILDHILGVYILFEYEILISNVYFHQSSITKIIPSEKPHQELFSWCGQFFSISRLYKGK